MVSFFPPPGRKRRSVPFFPVAQVLRSSSKQQIVADLWAGLVSCVVLVPQGMAYALLAGLPPVAGLYAALVAPLAYGVLGTSRQLSVGPVAMDSLLVAGALGALAPFSGDGYANAALTLALLVGVLQLLMGVLRLGFLVNLLSLPVISGFTSAAAVLIGLSQLKYLLGLPVQQAATLGGYLRQWPSLSWSFQFQPLLVGALGLFLLWAGKKWLPRVPISLFVVVALAFLVHVLDWHDRVPLVGQVPQGLPHFSWSRVTPELALRLLPSAFTLATLAFLESIAISKSYALKHKYTIHDNRELFALGLANIAAGSFSAYPVAGGFSRSAVNDSAGARSQLSMVVAAVGVGLSLLFLAPLLGLLPLVALSAVVLRAVTGLVDLAEFRRLERIKPADRWLLGLTFGSTLLWGMVPGVATGVVASLAWHVARTLRPHLAVLGRVPGTHIFRNVRRHHGLYTYQGVLIVRMDAEFYFGNVAFLHDALLGLEDEMREPLQALILDATAINDIDSSAEFALRQLNEEYMARSVQFYVAGLKGPVLDVLHSSGLAQELGNRGQCLSVHEALSVLNAQPQTSEPDVVVVSAQPSALAEDEPSSSAGVKEKSNQSRGSSNL